MRQRRLRDVDVMIGVRQSGWVRQGHLLARRDTLGVLLDGVPQRAVLGPSPRFEDLLFDSLEVFDDVSREPILGADDDLDDLVEVNGLELEGLEDPRKRPLRVVGEYDDLQTAGEQGLVEEILREEVVVRLSLGLLRHQDGLQQFVVEDLSHPEPLLGERLMRSGMVLRRSGVVRAEDFAQILNAFGDGFGWIDLEILLNQIDWTFSFC